MLSSSDLTDVYDDLPPITTETLPTERQRQITDQSWDRVSARQSIGSLGNGPSADTLISYISTILEGRLADVVMHRRELKLAYARRLTFEDDSPGTSTRSVEKFIADLGSSTEFSDGSFPAQATVLLTSTCRYQLRAYIRRIASLYRDNRYHCLEHATHVTMSANKLLEMLHERAVDLDDDVDNINESNSGTANAEWSLDANSNQMFWGMKNGCIPSYGGMLKDNKSWSNFVSMATARKSNVPGDFNGSNPRPKRSKLLRSFRQHVYSDIFSKFAFVFAAIIHDVDHQGVPNTRLVLENDPLVEHHGKSSVAEKHSIEVAFRTLSESDFDVFRSVIFESPADQFQMQCIVTNVVISTDIASPERAQSTRMRWDEAFIHPPPNSSLTFGKLSLARKSELSEIATVQASKPQLVPTQNLTATHQGEQLTRNSIKRSLQDLRSRSERDSADDDEDMRTAFQQRVVIETMLNVADVAHAMQSWELFLFWNRRLFEELYVAFKTGRSEIDPSVDWFENQLGFYKLYIIPLAEKMQKCGVFGKLGCVWTNNAVSIRDQWIRKGDQITKDMITSVKINFGEVSRTAVPQSCHRPSFDSTGAA